jgi:N-acetyl-anhydromuramyl-L-alanine amidase AmpD
MADVSGCYPSAVQKPLVGHSAPGTIAQKSLIVLHITGGSTVSGAFETFRFSQAPRRTSAHFIIDRDGTVYQLLPISDTAWHASMVNRISVGIEHVGIPDTLMCTEEQYAASALLVRWLCDALKIPCDRKHILTHNEASPADAHVLCCTGALNPDRVVAQAITRCCAKGQAGKCMQTVGWKK